jgi:hypothetical protein
MLKISREHDGVDRALAFVVAEFAAQQLR